MKDLTPEFIESELKRFAETPPQTGEVVHCMAVFAAALLILLQRSDWLD